MEYTIEDIRTKVRLLENKVENVHSSDFPHSCYSGDDAWDEEKFKQNFRIEIIHITKETKRHPGLGIELDVVDEMEFDMVGVDCSFANAIRRILLAEVPTMAIEKVHMYNTSIMQDEILAHRLGLVPIMADPSQFEYKQPETDDEGTEHDTLEFRLKLKCVNIPSNGDSVSRDPHIVYCNLKSSVPVTTKYLEWIPKGDQAKLMKVSPVKDNILLTKLKPGHELDLRMFCVKGIGKDHAKFSPVATATYRLLPLITIMRPVVGEQAERLQKCFSPGVIELQDGEHGQEAVVVNSRKDTVSREVFRHPDLKDAVKIERVRNHFIFSVESTGALRPEHLVVEAVRVLQNKCETLLQELESHTLSVQS